MVGFNVGGRRRLMFSRNQVFLLGALFLSLLCFTRYSPFRHSSTASRLISRLPRRLPHSGTGDLPNKIWQTWRAPFSEMEDELRYFATSWVHSNPGYRYELLLDEAAATFVKETYAARPDIVNVFTRIEDSILRADYIRYLAVLADGGVYSDIDTECTKPIDEWVPDEFKNNTGMVVGIEYDALDGPVREDFGTKLQLVQWTFMARAGNHVLQHVVDRVTHKLADFGRSSQMIEVTEENRGSVWDLTGPKIFTSAVFEAVSKKVGHPVGYSDITGLKEPKLIGDVLFMPINSFASGQEHSNSGAWNNEQQLVCHHFKRFANWKPDPPQTWPQHGRVHKNQHH